MQAELFFATSRPWCSVAGEPGLLFLTLLHYCAHQLPVVKNQPFHLNSVFFHIEFPKIDLCKILLCQGITGKACKFCILEVVFSDLLAIVQKRLMTQMCAVVMAQKGY